MTCFSRNFGSDGRPVAVAVWICCRLCRAIFGFGGNVKKDDVRKLNS